MKKRTEKKIIDNMKKDKNRIEKIINSIKENKNEYFSKSHFHISNMSDYTLMEYTIKDLIILYDIQETDAAEIIESCITYN